MYFIAISQKPLEKNIAFTLRDFEVAIFEHNDLVEFEKLNKKRHFKFEVIASGLTLDSLSSKKSEKSLLWYLSTLIIETFQKLNPWEFLGEGLHTFSLHGYIFSERNALDAGLVRALGEILEEVND